jgi:hypothetical protein
MKDVMTLALADRVMRTFHVVLTASVFVFLILVVW